MTELTTFRRVCSTRGEEKSLDEFYERPERSKRGGGVKSRCKACHRTAVSEYRKANREKVRACQKATVAKKPEHYKQKRREGYLRRKAAGEVQYTERDWETVIKKQYGITAEEYRRMLANQSGVCAICRRAVDYRLVVDHDHATNKVRALLCRTCNLGLGNFRDDRYLFEQAIAYLTRHS